MLYEYFLFAFSLSLRMFSLLNEQENSIQTQLCKKKTAYVNSWNGRYKESKFYIQNDNQIDKAR